MTSMICTERNVSTASAVILAASVAACLWSGAVSAAGFQIQEQSVKGLGNAFAGGAAIAEDASTVLYNPAGLSRLQQQIELGSHIIMPQADFKDAHSTNGIGGVPSGRSGDDGGAIAAVPNFFYANPIGDSNWTLGLGMSALYGLATEYDRNWIGRYHAVKSELTTLALNPAVSYQLNPQFSVGGGISIQYAAADLTNAIDFGTLGFLNGAPVQPSTRAFDGFTEVTGDDWGVGFNLGLLYQVSSGTRLGLGYRSKVDHTLNGENELTIPDFATGLAGPSRTRDAEASVSIPASLSLSAYHEVTPQWALMADVTWTDWSEFEELRIKFKEPEALRDVLPSPRDSVQPEEWEDTYRFSLGVNYHYSDALTLRGGIAYDETPLPSDELRTPRIPDNSRRWVTLGASYRPSDTLSFDFAYAHIFISDTPISDTELTTGGLAGVPIGSTLDGKYEASVDLLSAQVQWNF